MKNDKWIKFDTEDMDTWPEKNGYYHTCFAKNREDNDIIIEPIYYHKNDNLFRPGFWDTTEFEEDCEGYEFYYYSEPIEIPEFN